MGYSPWGCKELDLTEDLAHTYALYPTDLCKTRNAALKTKSNYPLKQSRSPVQKQEELGCSLSDTKGLNAHATAWFLIAFLHQGEDFHLRRKPKELQLSLRNSFLSLWVHLI